MEEAEGVEQQGEAHPLKGALEEAQEEVGVDHQERVDHQEEVDHHVGAGEAQDVVEGDQAASCLGACSSDGVGAAWAVVAYRVVVVEGAHPCDGVEWGEEANVEEVVHASPP